MTTRSRDLAVRLAAAALLLALLSACGDGDEPQADPTPSPSSPTESESTSSPTDTASPTDPAVPPATGRVISTKSFSFNAPEKWTVVGADLPFLDLERNPGSKSVLRDPHGLISITVLPSGRSFTLDQMANRSDAPGERLEDVEVDGEQVYHFSESDPAQSTESFGLWRKGFESVSMTFGLFGSTRAERAALAASVLASWEWR